MISVSVVMWWEGVRLHRFDIFEYIFNKKYKNFLIYTVYTFKCVFFCVHSHFSPSFLQLKYFNAKSFLSYSLSHLLTYFLAFLLIRSCLFCLLIAGYSRLLVILIIMNVNGRMWAILSTGSLNLSLCHFCS